MIIRKMTAVFGNLEGQSLELGDGLNVIYAPNESGKSTWCGFIRAMLYGIDSAQREKGGVKPDKLRFAPWSGKPMGGEMEIEKDGKFITLSRSTRSASAPMRFFSARYTGTAQKIEGISGLDAGETLTGMSRTVFDSSVFVGRSGLGVANSPELEKRIGSIVTTGEDGSESYTSADETLRAWLRRRRHNRSGAIPALDAEIAEKRRRLGDMESALALRLQAEKRLERAESEEKLAAEYLRRSAENRRSSLISQTAQCREALSSAESAAAAAREKAASLKAAAAAGPFGSMSPAEAMADAKSRSETLAALQAAVPGKTPVLITAIIAAAAAVAGIFLPPLLILAAVCAIVCVFLSLSARGKRKERDAFVLAMLHRYGTGDGDRISELALAHCASHAQWEKAEAEAAELSAAVLAAREALAEAERNMLAEARGGESGLAGSAAASVAAAREALAQSEGRLQAMGDPMVLETELAALTHRRSELQSQYDAIALAVSTLSEANAELQQRFSPRLSKRAGEYMSRLTGGKYSALAFDRELNALARPGGDTESRETGFLSSGTVDQLYLALRLAICSLALPEGYSCPLVLDDPLVNFDDERMAAAIDLFAEIAKERQVILFTCRRREREYAKEKYGI